MNRAGARNPLGGSRAGHALASVLDVIHRERYRRSAHGASSIERLKELAGAYAGKRCVIIGNGPSLERTNVGPLADEILFGLNRGYLLAERLGRSTNFLVVVNQLVLEQSHAEILAVPSLKFLGWPAYRPTQPLADVISVRSRRMPGFYDDLAEDGAWEGSTVTYVALQLAFHMGFERVVLIGVDHRFASVGEPHRVVVSDGPDRNHFDPSYFGTGYRWQLPDLPTSEVAFSLARDAFRDAGREVVDATVGGALHVFKRIPLEVALA